MHKQVIASTIVIALAITLVGVNSSVYALSSHGTSYGPSFGSGASVASSTYFATALSSAPLSYKDGLTINGETYDISKYIQQIPTKALYVGSPVTITTKLWEYGGTYQIQGVALFLNVNGNNPSATNSDTWVQYSKVNGVTVHDPHNILGKVTADVKYDQQFMYVTFHFTPVTPMKNTSDLILIAWDKQLSINTAKVINAVNISYVPFAYN